MTEKYAELRRLAEKSIAGGSALSAHITLLDFNVAANPSTILSLLDELETLERFKRAYMEWHDKTQWVQDTAEGRDLGKHRADVIADRFARMSAELERFSHRANQPYDDADVDAMQEQKP
jgi:hypothetical protein